MLARKAFCPITTACCSGVICEIVTGVALIVFFSLSAICQGVCLRPGRMGHPGRRCLRCDRGFLRYQKESLVSSRAPARVPHPRPEPVEGGIGGRNVGARVGMLAMSSRAPALFAGERDLSERFLGPTENVGPRNDNCTVPECGLPCPERTGEVGFACRDFVVSLSVNLKSRPIKPSQRAIHSARAPRRRA